MSTPSLRLLLKAALDRTETPHDLFMAVEDLPGIAVEATDTRVVFSGGVELKPIGLGRWVALQSPNHAQIAALIERAGGGHE